MIGSVTYSVPKSVEKAMLSLSLAGAAVFVAGLFFQPDRIWPAFLLALFYVVGLGTAGICFLALTYVSRAGWSAAIKRVPEVMTSILPYGAVMFAALLFGLHSLYEWSHEAVVAADPILRGRGEWFSIAPFMGRGLVILGAWIVFARLLVRNSRRQDETADLALTARNVRISAISLVVVAITYCLVSFDWIMSLSPHWYSTIFGLYNLTGMFLSGLAMIAVLVIVLRRSGILRHVIGEKHLEDLGRLIFAFSTFWMYIWFSQYLLIWYANIPEETTWFIRRESGSWLTFTVLNVAFNWVIPFIALMSRRAKRNEGLLLKICILLLFGRAIDLFWMIMPAFSENAPRMGLWEIGPLAGGLGLFFLLTLRALSRGYAIPVNDPMLVESLPAGISAHG